MTQVSPLVSIIVPVYNAEKYLRYSVDSILRQSYEHLEIILVDDGATDSSPMILDEYQRRDNRVRVIHQTNGGIAKAQNAGLDAAHGDYIAFADNDDILDRRNIELLLDYCMRFYERQFITRSAANKDILMKFEALIDNYFQSDKPQTEGLPSVKYFADKVFLSSNYFGDLVKKETGKTAQEYIQNKIIDLAKEMIIGSGKTVSQIAYELGYQYSQHFNRVFKKNVGYTPSEYRHLQV